MKMMTSHFNGGGFLLLLITTSALLPSQTLADCYISTEAINYAPISVVGKLTFTPLILTVAAVGLFFAIKGHKCLHPDSETILVSNAIYAAALLITAFANLLPEATKNLTCFCREDDDSFGLLAGAVAVTLIIYALFLDSILRWRIWKAVDVAARSRRSSTAGENGEARANHVPLTAEELAAERHSFNCQPEFFEFQMVLPGLVAQSLVVGTSMGASRREKNFLQLVYAVLIQYIFEGLRLGGSFSQAQYSKGTIAWLSILYCLTTPAGFGIGLLIWKFSKGWSSAGVIVEMILYAASAGMLIYRALVNVLATDSSRIKMRRSFGMQVTVITFLMIAVCFFIFIDHYYF